jgi:beta-lactamase regulating signal transducer with metallopeptidase domain
MILSWMVYALMITLFMALAAWALEAILRLRRWPVRGVWVLAIVGSLGIPVLSGILPSQDPVPLPAIPRVAGAAPSAEATSSVEWTNWTARPLSMVPSPAQDSRIDRLLLVLWGLTAVGLALSLAISYFALILRRRTWTEREVDGRPVWVSPDTGPAVVGFLRSRIVLPEWVLGDVRAKRHIVLMHEEEHVFAGDPRLLLGALVLWVAMPWNLGLWWIWRALRQAVETDCDRRVLARGVDPRAYGRLLLEVSERGTSHRLIVAALSESSSFLERRVRLMLNTKPERHLHRAAGAVLVATLAIVAACRMERPGQPPVPATGATYAVGEDGALTKVADSAAVTPADSVAKRGTVVLPSAEAAGSPVLSDSPGLDPVQRTVLRAIERFYPNVLAERIPGGRVNLYFLADAQGEMVKTSFDTEMRSGSCSATLVSGLGIAPDPHQIGGMGCGNFRQLTNLPNQVAVYWATLKPRSGEESAPATGPFLFAKVASQGRPSETMVRAAAEQYAADALRAGLPNGEGLWFVADSDHRVLQSGQWLVKGSSTAARNELERMLPGTRIGSVLMSSVKTGAGGAVDVVWATTAAPGEPSASHRSAEGDPFANVRTFAVATRVPGQEVRIRFEGEAARDPRALRIDGKFSRQGDVIVARTPFLLFVVSPAPFAARLTTGIPGGEIEMTTEAEGQRLAMTGTAIDVRRDAPGQPIRATANGSAKTAEQPKAPLIVGSMGGGRR